MSAEPPTRRDHGFSCGAGGGMLGSIVVAFVGAVILVGITRLLKTA
jgi:uncharacterized membrane protein YeaQ/YmgE (transglycosylase-associated protein family)